MDPTPATRALGAAKSSADALSGSTFIVDTAGASAATGFPAFLAGLYYFIMVPLVYIAIAILVAGIAVKIASILSAPAPAYSLKTFPAKKRPMLAALADSLAMPQIRKRKPLFWFFLVWFHLGMVFLFFGHLDLFPNVGIMPPESRHMIGAGFVGLSVTIPAFYFLGRRFFSENRRISVPSDYLLLLLLLFLFLLGDMISWGNSWTAHGFVMTKADFKNYFGILSSFSFADPRTVLHGSHYHFVVIHVFLAEIFLMILPFSKIVHSFFSIPLNALRRK
ncbi:MAG TPA: respiratory nitrate reductase subunit gamma [Rectinemataceae bacterium]